MTKNRRAPSSTKGARTRADPRRLITDLEQKIIWLSCTWSERCSRGSSLGVWLEKQLWEAGSSQTEKLLNPKPHRTRNDTGEQQLSFFTLGCFISTVFLIKLLI